MRYNRNTAGALLLTCVIILLATSLFITPTTISDTDASTYVIVPMLMLPLLLLFSLRARPEPSVGRWDAAVGAAAFLAFIILSIALRLYFSFFFVSFRVDVLLFPLALFALVSLLFGTRNAHRFRGAFLYVLLASPAILYPIISQANAFTQANTFIVYGLLRPLVSGVRYIAPITISANGYNIGIGQTCVSIGIFVSLALFLIPIVHFFDGELKRKVVWVASGIATLLVLNLVRMLSISFIWLGYGPNPTAFLVHSFVGVLLFYIVIALMILVAGRYGLQIEKVGKKKRVLRDKRAQELPMLVGLAFSLIYLYLTLNYSSALQISPLIIANRVAFNYTNSQVSSALAAMINRNNFSSLSLASRNGSYAVFTLTNRTISTSNPITMFAGAPSAQAVTQLVQGNLILGRLDFFGINGAREQVFDLVAGGTEYLVYHTNLPIVLANSTVTFSSIYLVVPLSVLPASLACSSYDPLYSGILNAASLKGYNQTTSAKMLTMECLSNRIVWQE